jgi:hypothetical protein
VALDALLAIAFSKVGVMLVAGMTGSAAQIAASMSSKSSSTCAGATFAPYCLPFLWFFGIFCVWRRNCGKKS